MLQLLLMNSLPSLPRKLQSLQHADSIKLPTDHLHDSNTKGCVHQVLQDLPITLLDGQGQTPLSLALGSRNAAAAGVLLLQGGMQLLQPVRDLSNESGHGVTHALLLAAKAASGWVAPAADATNPWQSFTDEAFGRVIWEKSGVLRSMFEPLAPEDAAYLGSWLAQQQQVLDALSSLSRKQMAALLLQDFCNVPAFGHLLLSQQVQKIIADKQQLAGLGVSEVYSVALAHVLCHGSDSKALGLLLQQVDIEPGSLAIGEPRVISQGIIDEMVAHLPKLLQIGLPPDCMVRSSSACPQVQAVSTARVLHGSSCVLFCTAIRFACHFDVHA